MLRVTIHDTTLAVITAVGAVAEEASFKDNPADRLGINSPARTVMHRSATLALNRQAPLKHPSGMLKALASRLKGSHCSIFIVYLFVTALLA